jgi:hypothetical protein
MAKYNINLPEEVAKDFELVNWTGSSRQYFGKHGVVDLQKLTPARAARLVQQGFTKLKRKSPSAKPVVSKKVEK